MPPVDVERRRRAGRLARARMVLVPALLGAAMLFSPAGAQVLPPGAKVPPAGAAPAQREYSDPLQAINRPIFKANLFFDSHLLRPVAKAYRWAVPKPGRRAVANFLDNVDSPAIFANDLLQGEWERAGTTTARFGINSTLGLAGFFDPARHMGLVYHDEDFGQTLGVYGVGGSPYLVLPILGSSNPRDGIGLFVDAAFDPLTWTGGDWALPTQLGLAGLDAVSQREAVLDQFDEIERTSLDFYAQVRSIYYQTRENEIKNGKNDFSDLPDLSGIDDSQ